MQVDFRFDLGDLVQVGSLNCQGIVQMQAHDKGGKLYNVQTVAGLAWYYEEQLFMLRRNPEHGPTTSSA